LSIGYSEERCASSSSISATASAESARSGTMVADIAIHFTTSPFGGVPQVHSPRVRRSLHFLRTFNEETPMYDMKNLSKFKALGELAPEAFKAFVAFDAAALKAGAIPLKYKELMAVAVALTTKCPYCIDIHAKKARQ